MKSKDQIYFELCKQYIDEKELEELGKTDPLLSLTERMRKEFFADLGSGTIFWSQFD